MDNLAKIFARKNCANSKFWSVGWLDVFYSMSTLIGYLIPGTVYKKKN